MGKLFVCYRQSESLLYLSYRVLGMGGSFGFAVVMFPEGVVGVHFGVPRETKLLCC